MVKNAECLITVKGGEEEGGREGRGGGLGSGGEEERIGGGGEREMRTRVLFPRTPELIPAKLFQNRTITLNIIPIGVTAAGAANVYTPRINCWHDCRRGKVMSKLHL